MRLRVAHTSVYHFDPPASGVIQVLRLTPRNHEGQYVTDWRIDVSPDARLAARDDAFGNITHVFTTDGPLKELRVEVLGQVETQSGTGAIRGTVERFPPSLYLRDTSLTEADQPIRDFAEKIRTGAGDNTLSVLHGLLDQLHEDMKCDAAFEENDQAASSNAARAFAQKRGRPQDLAHIFIGAAHVLGIPCRYVGGYFHKPDTKDASETAHAWAEAYVPDLGWVAFDPANGVCPTDAHVRVAIGLDYFGAAPVRGTRLGLGGETIAVAIKVNQ